MESYPTNKERTNFARLSRAIIDLCADALRDNLNRKVRPIELISKFSSCLGWNKLYLQQKNNINDAKSLNSYKKFDITLLYHVLRSIGTQELRDVLLNQIPPKHIQSVVSKCPALSVSRTKLKKAAENNSYADFKDELLFKLFNNLCPIENPNILHPTMPWGQEPGTADLTLGDDIERIRLIRNGLYGHLPSTEISDMEFNKEWNKLEEIMVRMESYDNGATYKQDLDCIKTVCMDEETEKRYCEEIKMLAEREIQLEEKVRKVEERLDMVDEHLKGRPPASDIQRSKAKQAKTARKVHFIYHYKDHSTSRPKEMKDRLKRDNELALPFVKHLEKWILKKFGERVECIYHEKSVLPGKNKFQVSLNNVENADAILVIVTPEFTNSVFPKFQQDIAFNKRLSSDDATVIPIIVGNNTEIPKMFDVVESNPLIFDDIDFQSETNYKNNWELLEKSLKEAIRDEEIDTEYRDSAVGSRDTGPIQHTQAVTKNDRQSLHELNAKGTKCCNPDDLKKALFASSFLKDKQGDVVKRLLHNCDSCGLEFYGDTPGNGNCFFEAISSQFRRLGLPERSPDELRESVTNYIRNNRSYQGLHGPVSLEDFVEGDFEDYCDSMSHNGVWADHVIVIGMSNMLKNDILIITSSPDAGPDNSLIWVVGDITARKNPLLLGHCWENHYRSLQPKGASATAAATTTTATAAATTTTTSTAAATTTTTASTTATAAATTTTTSKAAATTTYVRNAHCNNENSNIDRSGSMDFSDLTVNNGSLSNSFAAPLPSSYVNDSEKASSCDPGDTTISAYNSYSEADLRQAPTLDPQSIPCESYTDSRIPKASSVTASSNTMEENVPNKTPDQTESSMNSTKGASSDRSMLHRVGQFLSGPVLRMATTSLDILYRDQFHK